MAWSIRRAASAAALACFAMIMAGCVQQPMQAQISEFKRDVHEPRILLMPVDIQLSELTAGGLEEPKADWTDAAREHVVSVLHEEQAQRKNQMLDFRDDVDAAEADQVRELSKLHGLIGATALIHSLPNLALPNKAGKFDWALGPEVAKFRTRYDADYALFIYIRDSYSSGGRAAVIAIGALFGVHVQGGVQAGYASLVDLNTGDIVWFNKLARLSGDLRTKEPAQESIRLLLTGLPK